MTLFTRSIFLFVIYEYQHYNNYFIIENKKAPGRVGGGDLVDLHFYERTINTFLIDECVIGLQQCSALSCRNLELRFAIDELKQDFGLTKGDALHCFLEDVITSDVPSSKDEFPIYNLKHCAADEVFHHIILL